MCLAMTQIAGRSGEPRPERLIRLLPLMDLSSGAPRVTVGLIDGPVNLDHPDLAKGNIRLLNGVGGGACINLDSIACAHGTYVAGLLHARRESPVRGICPDCTLVVRPIFSEATVVTRAKSLPNATIQELTAALRQLIETGVRIINLSVGLNDPPGRSEPALNELLDRAAHRGVIIVAAGGNERMLCSSAITRHPWVIPVVACDRSGHVLAQSNLSSATGRNGVMAVGQEIHSLAASGGYATFSGSSAAVPFVTGSIALLWSVFPMATASQLRVAITGGVNRRRSIVPPLLDAWSAYRLLKSIN
jgi:subtilisin family serine protease